MKVKSVVIVVCCLPVKEVIAAVTDLVPWLDAWKFDKISKKYAPPGLFFNLPGRGVLQILTGVYRNPVHILLFLAIFSIFLQI